MTPKWQWLRDLCAKALVTFECGCEPGYTHCTRCDGQRKAKQDLGIAARTAVPEILDENDKLTQLMIDQADLNERILTAAEKQDARVRRLEEVLRKIGSARVPVRAEVLISEARKALEEVT